VSWQGFRDGSRAVDMNVYANYGAMPRCVDLLCIPTSSGPTVCAESGHLTMTELDEVRLRLPQLLHSRCFPINQNWEGNENFSTSPSLACSL
jgi:hypothetical protein